MEKRRLAECTGVEDWRSIRAVAALSVSLQKSKLSFGYDTPQLKLCKASLLQPWPECKGASFFPDAFGCHNTFTASLSSTLAA